MVDSILRVITSLKLGYVWIVISHLAIGCLNCRFNDNFVSICIFQLKGLIVDVSGVDGIKINERYW